MARAVRLVTQPRRGQSWAMRIHHLNCISECALGGAMMDGRTLGLRACLSVHCLAVETPDGLVLVDTGFGLGDVHHPRKRLSPSPPAMSSTSS